MTENLDSSPVEENLKDQEENNIITEDTYEEFDPFNEEKVLVPTSQEDDDKKYIIKIRGLPWSASFTDIENFFKDIPITNGIKGVVFNNARDGRPSGEAFIEFSNIEDYKKALRLDKNYMESRYIEVFEGDFDDYEYFKNRSKFEDRLVRLRGLPYSCTIQQIEEFFSGLEIVPDGISIPKDEEGRSNEAFVQFNDDLSFEAAMRKHKEKMGHRYIEVFYSNFKEKHFAQGEAREPNSASNIQPLMSLKPIPPGFEDANNCQSEMTKMVNASSMTQTEKENMIEVINNMMNNSSTGSGPSKSYMMWMNNMMSAMGGYGGGSSGMYSPSGGTKYWVKLRGLPFSTDEDDILRFFKPFLPLKVRVETDRKGKATGEGFAEFQSHEVAMQAIQDKNKKNIGHRYIELFYESPDDDYPPRNRKKRGYDSSESTGYNHLSSSSQQQQTGGGGRNFFPANNSGGRGGYMGGGGGDKGRGFKRGGGGGGGNDSSGAFNTYSSNPAAINPYNSAKNGGTINPLMQQQQKKRGPLPGTNASSAMNMMNQFAAVAAAAASSSNPFAYDTSGAMNNNAFMGAMMGPGAGGPLPMFMPPGMMGVGSNNLGPTGQQQQQQQPLAPTIYYPNMSF